MNEKPEQMTNHNESSANVDVSGNAGPIEDGQAAAAMQSMRQARAGRRRERLLVALRTYATAFGFLLAAAGALCLLATQLSTPPRILPSVLLLPLDSRPVNTDLPRQLASIGGIDLVMPKSDILDQFLTPSNPETLYAWLRDVGESLFDVSVIHLNELLFGGLLHSREFSQYQNANEKMQTLFDYLLRRNPSTSNKLVLVYILPRLLPSQYDEAMWAYEKELPELSQLRHRQALSTSDPGLAEQIRVLEGSIPREIRTRYERVYTEAYNTCALLLDWLQSGLIGEVVIGLAVVA
ncbi:MAG: DUF4127 family protein, partial [Clostridiales bacterium]|nr:DUF4127 family protein [Clostridiales bacterium]